MHEKIFSENTTKQTLYTSFERMASVHCNVYTSVTSNILGEYK